MTLLSNDFLLMSYLRGIYLEWWFSKLVGEVQKTLKKKEENREKKNIEKGRERQAKNQGKSINSNKRLWFYFLYK